MFRKPWLLLPVAYAHKLAPRGTRLSAMLWGQAEPETWNSFTWKTLKFPNPLGIAGGVDKNAENILDWQSLGVGFVEVGTITPKAQSVNSGKVVDRNVEKKWLWNRLGFPSDGVEKVITRMKKSEKKRRVPLFANIGKNRQTPNEEAFVDYLTLIDALDSHCDAFVINISSPNTQSLRDLLEPMALRRLLGQIQRKNSSTKPMLLKLSPDIDDVQCLSIINIAVDFGIEGFVLANTLMNSDNYFPDHVGGGVSGEALKDRSEELLKLVAIHLKKRGHKKLLVSVGGVLNTADVMRRLDLGADLVQTYSALVFEGPQFFKNVAQEAKCP